MDAFAMALISPLNLVPRSARGIAACGSVPA
jgi:hypothetical protein